MEIKFRHADDSLRHNLSRWLKGELKPIEKLRTVQGVRSALNFNRGTSSSVGYEYWEFNRNTVQSIMLMYSLPSSGLDNHFSITMTRCWKESTYDSEVFSEVIDVEKLILDANVAVGNSDIETILENRVPTFAGFQQLSP